ncbi:MAG: DUF5071 domain-containing protein [Clostridiales bacterium]|jgi:Uma2 family endonuclease|nr:DUF5071 domain-containing protein [Clostridiales bacterium]
MSEIFNLIPKDKHDISGMETLRTIDIDKVEPILCKLLECMKDGNWPCARELLDIMPRFHSLLVPHIKDIFNSDDGDWKWFILLLVERFPMETIELLEADIERMAAQPTMDEVYSEANEEAYRFLDKLNDRFIDRLPKEIINGKVVTMAYPWIDNRRASANISRIFDNHLDRKSCEMFVRVGVNLAGSLVIPDISVVRDLEKVIREDAIYGAPDLIVEFLTSATIARLRIDKMKLYEQSGVKEYWIADTKNRAVEVYVLKNNKFEIDGIYAVCNESDLWEMTEEEKAAIITEFKTSLFEDLVISIKEIFRDVME